MLLGENISWKVGRVLEASSHRDVSVLIVPFNFYVKPRSQLSVRNLRSCNVCIFQGVTIFQKSPWIYSLANCWSQAHMQVWMFLYIWPINCSQRMHAAIMRLVYMPIGSRWESCLPLCRSLGCHNFGSLLCVLTPLEWGWQIVVAVLLTMCTALILHTGVARPGHMYQIVDGCRIYWWWSGNTYRLRDWV